MLAADGRCKTLDRRANGYVRGEGVGSVAVGKERSCEDSDGLSLHVACLRSSAVRHDGTSASLTAPNGSAQAELLCVARARAAAPHALVELHGTGTLLGDPTEVRALTQALGGMVPVSGVKASLGHLEPTAGMVGLQSLLAALKSWLVAPNAQLRALNPKVAASLAGGGATEWRMPSNTLTSLST